MRSVAVAAFTVALSFWSGAALACACCADPASVIDETRQLDAFGRSELADLRFPGQALYSGPWTEAETREEMTEVGRGPYPFRVRQGPVGLAFELDGPNGASARLVLPWPETLSRRAVDPAPGEGGAAEVLLFTEWRMQGAAVAASGVWSSMKGRPVDLRLLGRANGCGILSAGATHFILTLSPELGRWRVYGALGG